MSLADVQQQKVNPRYLKLSYTLRLVACLLLLAIYCSVFLPEGQTSTALWTYILIHTLVYPHVCYVLLTSKHQDHYVVLFDAFLYGWAGGLLGLNPYFVAVLIIGNSMTNLASGGVKFCFQGLGLHLTGMVIGFIAIGFEFREQLPLLTLVLASTCLLMYTTFLSFNTFAINQKLLAKRQDLNRRTDELAHVNHLALTVNHNLELESIIQAMMDSFEKLYPFESIFVIRYIQGRSKIKIEGAYGSALNDNEIAAYKQMVFDIKKDQYSIFVSCLEKNRIVNIPNLTPEWVSKGAEVDQALYKVKPSHSIFCFPIYVDGVVEGGVSFINYHKPLTLSDHDSNLIQEYLVQVGNASKNLRLYEEAKQAKQEAERSERAKSSFLANMSHEIRTPLTAIIGYSEVLLDKTISEEEKDNYTNTIISSGNHLLHVINDILDVSKLESERFSVEIEEVSIPSLINDLSDYLSLHAKDKQLESGLDIHFPIPASIKSDGTRIKQILFNLVSNAVKFTEQGSVHIEVSYHDEHLIFNVKDTGIGLSPEEQERIFKEFSQADSSITRLYGGTGLGLYISKNLAQLLNGDLIVESQQLGGSCFTFSFIVGKPNKLNMIEHQENYDNYLKSYLKLTQPASLPEFSGHILVAEDNLVNQKLIHKLLTRVGLEVTMVDNGEDAIDYSRSNYYDLILMDMQMPVLGGLDATKVIREENRVPIIAFTANVLSDQVQSYLTAGFNDVLPKPIDQTRLYEILQTHLNKPDTDKSIMIIEDNLVNQRILKRMVATADPNLVINTREDATEAIQFLMHHNFDMVLMDALMPGLNGIDAIKAIRQTGYKGKLYMLVDECNPDKKRVAIESGADGCLLKPLNKEEIVRLIHTELTC